jgi:hypothetical protein
MIRSNFRGTREITGEQAIRTTNRRCASSSASGVARRTGEGEGARTSRMMSVAVLEANGEHEGALSVVRAIRVEDPRACVESMGTMLDRYRDATQRETVVRALLGAGLPAEPTT